MSSLASQAALDTLLKFGPQKSVLAQLKREAEEQYVGTVRGSAGAAGETVQAIHQAQPHVAAIYDNAGLGAKQTGTLLGSDLSKLGGAAAGYKAAASTEQAGAIANLQRGKTQALQQLAQQAIQAKEGGQFAANQAAVVLSKALSGLSAKGQELAGEQGAYNVSDLEKLTHEHETLSQRERSSERSAGIDPNTGKPIPGGKLDKATNPMLGLKEQTAAASTIQAIARIAKRGLAAGGKRAHLVEVLSEGQPEESRVKETGKRDAEGKIIKQTEKLPAVPAYKPDVLMSAALDFAELGYLQRGTQHRLEQSGYSVGRLGVPTYDQWVKSNGQRRAIAKPVKEVVSGIQKGF